MKAAEIFITILLMLGCKPERESTMRAHNFDVILTCSDQGDRIYLRKGLIEYYNRKDVGDVLFELDSMESDRIFQSVPWDLLRELPDHYEPLGNQLIGNDFCEIQFTNGSLRKTIKLSNYDDFGDQSHTAQRIRECIGITHKIVRRKSDVKPLIMIEM